MKHFLLIILSLTACSHHFPVKQEPYDPHCNEICFQECEPLIKWQSGTADEAIALLKTDGVQYMQCEIRREACVECLERLLKANVIKMGYRH